MAINQKLHQYRFGKRCKALKSFFHPSAKREHRNFPRGRYETTWEYVSEYFRLNPQFLEGSWLR